MTTPLEVGKVYSWDSGGQVRYFLVVSVRVIRAMVSGGREVSALVWSIVDLLETDAHEEFHEGSYIHEHAREIA